MVVGLGYLLGGNALWSEYLIQVRFFAPENYTKWSRICKSINEVFDRIKAPFEYSCTTQHTICAFVMVLF